MDKAPGMTSHDVVARVRRIIGTRKVGHAGTLDPMATGVLVLGVERATRLLGHLALDTKAYLASISLGATTTTDDIEGEILSEVDGSTVDEEELKAGIAVLTGPIQQVPSSVSAVKVDGKRAYARVRSGEEVVLPARPVRVDRFDLLALHRTGTATEIDVLVECSSGTYVRALARDLGAALGVGGHLVALRRTRVGPFALAAARTLEQLESEPTMSLDLDAAVAAAFDRRDVAADEATAITHGQRLRPAGLTGTYGVFSPEGRALALAVDEGEQARALLVLVPAG
ncbi:MAG: tRNA pseudouridine(55) synthase TruB [Sciscionella sp.]